MYQQAFFTVPNRIMQLPDLTLALLRFYETIFQFWHHDKDCYLTNRMIKERTGITSSSTIQEAFCYFESHNEMLRVVKNGKRYVVQPTKEIRQAEEEPDDPVDNSEPNKGDLSVAQEGGSRCTERGGLAVPRHNKNNTNNINIKNKSYCASDVAQPLFETFWNTYPTKKNKKRSKEIWKRKKYDWIAQIILKDVQHRILNDAQWRNAQYIPHPSTYLLNERWEDEITIQAETTHTSNRKQSNTAKVLGSLFA